MANNWAFIIWVGVIALLHNILEGRQEALTSRKVVQRTSWPWAIIMFLPVIIGAIFRKASEGDTGTYQAMFEDCPSHLSQIIPYLAAASRDKGYSAWSVLFKSIFGNNFRLFLAVNVIFCSIILIYIYRKYSSSYAISIFLFIAGFEYFQWMFNGIRQFIAVCIVLSCTENIIAHRYRRIIIPFAIAASFHMSVLIVLPCLLFVCGTAFNRRMCFVLAIVLFLGVLLGKTGHLNTIIAELMQSTQYDSVLNEFYETMNSGTNYLRVLVYLIPTIIAIIGLPYIRQANDPMINFCTNMCAISSVIYIVSMFTSALMIGRLPIYFSIYNYILLPWEVSHIFELRSSKLITLTLVVCYLLYNFFQVSITYQQPFTLGFLSFI